MSRCFYELHWYQRDQLVQLSQTSFDQDEAHLLFANLAGRRDVITASLHYIENGMKELVSGF